MSKLYTGVDIGTSSCKVCIFDEEGYYLGTGQKTYPSYYPQPGLVEQKEEDILKGVYDACKEAVINAGVDRKDIVAVSFSTMSSTTTLCDEDNHFVNGVMIGWQDVRGAMPELMEEFVGKVGPQTFYEVTGHPVMPLAAIPGRYLWFQKFAPEDFKKAVHICSVQDWILKKFGADGYYIDAPNAVRLGLANSATYEWDERLVEAAGIRMEQLSEIVHEAGKVVGHVTPEVAAKSGLPVGCAVCVGAHDQDISSTGAGGVKAGVTVVTMGTIGTFTSITDKPFRRAEMDIVCHAKQGLNLWNAEIFSTTSAAAFQWFSDALCNAEDGITNPGAPISFDQIGEAAAKAPIGCNGITFVPRLQESQGGFFGLYLGATKGEMARSVMESLCYNMKETSKFQDKLGIETKEIRLCGGVTKNPFWCQMLADILECPIVLNTVREVGCLGVAMLATVGTGKYKNVEEAAEHMVRLKQRFEPNAENQEAYREAFKRWQECSALLY